MTDQDNIKLVFTGSSVEAGFIQSILAENGIEYMLRDSLTESIHAGWASGTTSTSSRIFVAHEHEEKAKQLIAEYLQSNGSQS